jgi:uncharacterized protein YndB with AHSA1/START domain
MPEINNPDVVLSTERVLPFNPEEVFDAFRQPERLARWWGPKGFTNTFDQFEFEVGGRWVFTMHAPNGANYANESVFEEVLPGEKIVIRHIPPPQFTLTVTLSPRDDGTHLAWDQEFETAEMAAKLRPLSKTANEENLDRLHAVLSGETP